MVPISDNNRIANKNEESKRYSVQVNDEAWREDCRKKQAAGVKFQIKHPNAGWFPYDAPYDSKFDGNKEDYREVQEVPKSNSAVPHIKERALYWAQRVAGTNEVWLEQASDNNGCWWEVDNDFEPEWIPKHKYRVKPMKLTARIVRRKELPFDPFKVQVQDWEFFGTREEYRAECEKYGYVVVSEIKEVKPKTVKYYFALMRYADQAPQVIGPYSNKNSLAEYFTNSKWTIIGNIEEREV